MGKMGVRGGVRLPRAPILPLILARAEQLKNYKIVTDLERGER